jgi:S-DNA-T family DNA segregation ATPase FtsK/SpoIIIE
MKTIFLGTYNTVPAEIFQNNNEWRTSSESKKWAKGVASVVIAKLAALEITATCEEITVGATTTTLRLIPAPEVRMSKFARIEDDLSIAVGAKCRVLAPITGTTFVGIEIPNKEREIVHFGGICGKATGELPVSLGVCPDGTSLTFDLAELPHLLIAGASGQGKSVGLNVILMSLLASMHPRDLNLYLIDPKRVEFSDYEPLECTRMLRMIDTDTESAKDTLSELCEEMDERYEKLRRAGVRKLKDYNSSVEVDERLPYIVCLIDEFSDLMAKEGREKRVESNIVRLAQLGRAAGVHLIVATQRPDANVITGLIKANFPARITFRTATGIDSKIIIDRGGAQQLSGAGDALFSMNGELTRFQCAYVSDAEIRDAVFHCIQQLDTMEIVDVLPPKPTLTDITKEAFSRETTPERLDALALNENESVRRRVARNPNTWTETLEVMAEADECEKVRYYVATNLNTPFTSLAFLRDDVCPIVKFAATRTFCQRGRGEWRWPEKIVPPQTYGFPKKDNWFAQLWSDFKYACLS